MSAREWYSMQNKVLSSVLQTFREMRIGVIFTTPSLRFIDVHARKLFHHYLQTKYIDRENEIGYLKIYGVEENEMTGKTIFRFPRIYEQGGKAYRIRSIGVPKPSKDVCQAYEKYHKEFKKKIREDALRKIKGEPNEDQQADQDAMVADILQRHNKYKRGKQWI
jgi:hypothetical protein